MYNFHPTPELIISIISKHFPKKKSVILDPAVGDGALISKLLNSKHSVTAVDIDIEKIKNVSTNSELFCINSDFLSLELPKEEFDLVICNPPFNGRKSYFYKNKKVPIEAMFLARSVDLVKDNGKLIFILPNSVTSGSRLAWFRSDLLNELHLSHSYKLQKFSFQKVEGDFSILVFKKMLSRGDTNWILKDGSKYSLNLKKLGNNFSFDAEENVSAHRALINENQNDVEYRAFEESFSVQRGKITGNYKDNQYFHTTGIKFHLDNLVNSYLDEEHCAQKSVMCTGDLFISRVSRNLTQSLSIYKGETKPFTDCIIKIIANNHNDKLPLFFSLSIALQSAGTKSLIEKGSGAKYLSIKALKKLKIPLNLHLLLPDYYRRFLTASHKERLEISQRVNFLLNNLEHNRLFSKFTEYRVDNFKNRA
jgi:hypothetical protein